MFPAGKRYKIPTVNRCKKIPAGKSCRKVSADRSCKKIPAGKIFEILDSKEYEIALCKRNEYNYEMNTEYKAEIKPETTVERNYDESTEDKHEDEDDGILEGRYMCVTNCESDMRDEEGKGENSKIRHDKEDSKIRDEEKHASENINNSIWHEQRRNRPRS